MMRFILPVLFAIAASAPPAAAGDHARKAARMWNPATVASVAGTVEAVVRVEMGDSWRCVRLTLRTGEGLLQIRLAPDWYLAERKLEFTTGQKLEVKGSRLTFAGEPTVIAGELRRDGERFVLRDAAGEAAWSTKGD